MPDKVHARMRPSYDMKGYESVKIVKNIEDIATHNKTYEAVVDLCKRAQSALHNKKMELAEQLLKKVYVRLTKVSVKHPISVDEFVSYLRKKDVLMTFTQNMSSVADSISKVMKYEGVITKSIAALQNLKDLYSKDQLDKKDKAAINDNVSQLKQARNELRDGYKKMRVVVNFLKIANEFMPSGADTMLDLNFTVFEEAGKAIDILEKHAEKITEGATEVTRNTQRMYHEPNSKYNAYTKARNETNRDAADNWVFDKWPKRKK